MIGTSSIILLIMTMSSATYPFIVISRYTIHMKLLIWVFYRTGNNKSTSCSNCGSGHSNSSDDVVGLIVRIVVIPCAVVLLLVVAIAVAVVVVLGKERRTRQAMVNG